MEYPQQLRNAWADAYATMCSATWRAVDAHTAWCLALMSRGEAAAKAQYDQRMAELAEAKQRHAAARAALRAAESEFYGA